MNSPRLLAALGAVTVAVSSLLAAEVQKITPAEAAQLVAEKKAVLVDCREPAEWAETGVAAPAVLLPKSDFDAEKKQWTRFLEKNKGKQVIVYCRTGRRSGIVAEELAKQGYNAANGGGLKDWQEAGLPTRKVEAK